jgi:hypothetical protein
VSRAERPIYEILDRISKENPCEALPRLQSGKPALTAIRMNLTKSLLLVSSSLLLASLAP